MVNQIQQKQKRKFLKAIYEIQRKFGVEFAGVSRTFSFGIKPMPEQRVRLEEWFRQTESAKSELYQEIFKDFQKAPARYLGSKFDYGTFFKGSAALKRAKAKYPLLTTQPVGEGLRMEIAIPSFITNHRRRFAEIIQSAEAVKEQIGSNIAGLNGLDFEFDTNALVRNLDAMSTQEYREIVKTYPTLQAFEKLIASTNTLIADYNYTMNQAIAGQNAPEARMLDKIGRLDTFPGSKVRDISDETEMIGELRRLATRAAESSRVIQYIAKTAKKAVRRVPHQKRSFERRLAYWLAVQAKSDPEKVGLFLEEISKRLSELEKHAIRKPFDAANRGLYYGLLAFRAYLANPEKREEIATLRSQLAAAPFKVRGEREIITLPGFSWGAQKPLKNIALAFRGKQLWVCIAASAKPFRIGNNGAPLRFLKTSGGSRQKAARKPKTVAYVFGDFDTQGEGLPLLLPLHFGKSHARRYLMNKLWGLFSEDPKVFLNNARLKRTKKNPGDPWGYFLDVTLSSDEKTFGFKDFQKNILKQVETVIGIDRGEVNPIAYALVRMSGEVVKAGILGRTEYTEKLKAYDSQRKIQQFRGRLVSKSLRAKISQLQKTALETANSEIISLAANHRSAIAIEDLGARFSGREWSLIPKKTYKRVEDLLANALNFAGLLRIGSRGPVKYWGGLLPVIAAGTSATCPHCGRRWRSRRPSERGIKAAAPFYAITEILTDAKGRNFQNVDTAKGKIVYEGAKLTLNPEWKIYSRQKPQGEAKTLNDLARAIRYGKDDSAEQLLRGALSHRPVRDTFVCHACGFSGDADEIAAVNIARRGVAKIDRILTQ